MFVVTGSGHSGTGWASEFFTQLGFPCGHEEWFNERLYRGMRTSDASWAAVPRLAVIGDAPLILLLRDPLAVVQSFLRSGTYRSPNTSCVMTRYTYDQLPSLKSTPDELGRCIVRTADWDMPAQSHHLLMTLRIEDMALNSPDWWDEVSAMVRFVTGETVSEDKAGQVLYDLGKNYNAHARDARVDLSWEDILKHPLGYKLVERATQFGYEVN
jgi:hypothetical protein